MKLCLTLGAVFALSVVSSSHAAVLHYGATLNGVNETPANASPGTGSATVTIDTTAQTMRVAASFSGLLGATTAAHIHGPTLVAGSGTAGVITTAPSFVGFPLGVTSGAVDQTYDMTLSSSYTASFLNANGLTTTGAFQALLMYLADGTAYFNVHTASFPGGEIRGFLVAIPEPASAAFAATGLMLLGRRRR